MNFISLREYFYKLANRCYLLVLLPLAVFIYIYFLLLSKKIVAFIVDDSLIGMIVLGVLTGLCLANLTTVHWVSRQRLKKYSAEVGLGNKLDRYFEVVMFRMKASAVSSLMMAAGLLLTGSEWFAISFMLILVWVLFQWPSSARACRDLKLKGDEREMVFFKKDRF